MSLERESVREQSAISSGITNHLDFQCRHIFVLDTLSNSYNEHIPYPVLSYYVPSSVRFEFFVRSHLSRGKVKDILSTAVTSKYVITGIQNCLYMYLISSHLILSCLPHHVLALHPHVEFLLIRILKTLEMIIVISPFYFRRRYGHSGWESC